MSSANINNAVPKERTGVWADPSSELTCCWSAQPTGARARLVLTTDVKAKCARVVSLVRDEHGSLLRLVLFAFIRSSLSRLLVIVLVCSFHCLCLGLAFDRRGSNVPESFSGRVPRAGGAWRGARRGQGRGRESWPRHVATSACAMHAGADGDPQMANLHACTQ